MAYSIPQDTIERVRSQADIVQVVSEYLTLKKAGGNFRALCPFHQEKTPSFMVSPSKQIYHCFGCGAGGNVFGFLMQQEGFTLSEVRPGGVYHTLGLKNGDILLGVNGLELSDPASALQAFTAIKGANRIKVDIVRNGSPMTLRYTLR